MENYILSVLEDKNIVDIERAKAYNILLDTIGFRKIGLVTMTIPEMKAPYRNRLIKIGRHLCNINVNYENSVNNQRVRENKSPTFEAVSNWHNPVLRENGTYTPFCEHSKTKEIYLRITLDKVIKELFVDTQDGLVLEKSTIKEFFRKKSTPPNQDLTKSVQFFTPKWSNVKCLITNGVTYLIKDNNNGRE